MLSLKLQVSIAFLITIAAAVIIAHDSTPRHRGFVARRFGRRGDTTHSGSYATDSPLKQATDSSATSFLFLGELHTGKQEDYTKPPCNETGPTATSLTKNKDDGTVPPAPSLADALPPPNKTQETKEPCKDDSPESATGQLNPKLLAGPPSSSPSPPSSEHTKKEEACNKPLCMTIDEPSIKTPPTQPPPSSNSSSIPNTPPSKLGETNALTNSLPQNSQPPKSGISGSQGEDAKLPCNEDFINSTDAHPSGPISPNEIPVNVQNNHAKFQGDYS